MFVVMATWQMPEETEQHPLTKTFTLVDEAERYAEHMAAIVGKPYGASATYTEHGYEIQLPKAHVTFGVVEQ